MLSFPRFLGFGVLLHGALLIVNAYCTVQRCASLTLKTASVLCSQFKCSTVHFISAVNCALLPGKHPSGPIWRVSLSIVKFLILT